MKSYGVALVVILFCVIYLLFRLLRTYTIRKLLGIDRFFEGIWLEIYSVNEAARDAPAKLVPYRSVMVIKKNSDSGKFKIYGSSFRNKNMNHYSQYDCQLLKVDEENFSIDMVYSGQWYPEHSPADGYARYEFHEDSNLRGKKTSAKGKWLEIEHDQTPWNSYGSTEVKKIDEKTVKEKIGKGFPDRLSPQDFFALAYEA